MKEEQIPTDEAIELAKEPKFSNLIANYFRDHLDFDFQSTDEYDDWKNDAHELRNKVVHEGWHVTEEEARNAYDAVQRAIAVLIERFDEELQGTNLYADIEWPDQS